MKAKKILGMLLLALTSCAVDDTFSINPETIHQKSDNYTIEQDGNLIKNPSNHKGAEVITNFKSRNQNSPSYTNVSYDTYIPRSGMPTAEHSIYEFDVITIEYPFGTSYSKMQDIRLKYYEKYPELRLIVSNDTNISLSHSREYWLVKSNTYRDNNIGNGTDYRDEDEELTAFPCGGCPVSGSEEHLLLIYSIKQDIRNNNLIELVD